MPLTVGALVRTPPSDVSESSKLTPPGTPFVSVSLEYEGGVEVKMEASLVVDVEYNGTFPLKSGCPPVPSGGCVEELWRSASSDGLWTGPCWVDLTPGTGSVVVSC